MYLDISDVCLELSKVYFLFEPASHEDVSITGQKEAKPCREVFILHFVNLTRRTTCHFGEQEPSDDNGNSASTSEAKHVSMSKTLFFISIGSRRVTD